MCTYKKVITNPYTGQRLVVPCGHCESCKQQKANRTKNRIRNTLSVGKVALFVTLTYSDNFVPYVLKSDLENENRIELPIRRDCSVRRFRNETIVRSTPFSIIDNFSLVDEDTGEIIRHGLEFFPNLWKKGHGFNQERMGVCYYKDIQNFYKRLRTNLLRKFGDSAPSFQFFATTEYGSDKKRPHSHHLVICSADDYQRIWDAIYESWLFSNRDAIEIEIARDAAAYVSSYVNCDTSLPQVFQEYFVQKRSASKGFGVGLHAFSLGEVLLKTYDGSLSYSRKVTIDGAPQILDVPIPKYVINRYFPSFKSLCNLSDREIRRCLFDPANFFRTRAAQSLEKFDDDEIHRFTVRLINAQKRYIELFPRLDEGYRNVYDYVEDYIRCWSVYRSTIYRLSFQSIDGKPINYFEHYDNIVDYFTGSCRSYSLDFLLNPQKNYQLDFNKFKNNVELSDYYTDLYRRKVKQRRATNLVMASGLNINV